VNALYADIVRDPRHRDVTLLDYSEIAARRFAGWRMGCVSLNRVNQGAILRFSEGPVLDPFAMSGAAALALLEELVSTAAIASGERGCPGARGTLDSGSRALRPGREGAP
jgi:hypothetical protein